MYARIFKQMKKLLRDTQPIIENSDKVYQTCVTNVQSTTRIVSPPTKLPLQEIAEAYPGMVKYNSKKFAAAIAHAHFGIRVTTCMMYEAGQIVVIGAISLQHSLYAAQMFRLLISTIKAAFYDRALGKIRITSLGPRTQFEGFEVGNIVATSDLPWGVKLKQFRDQMQRDAHYSPERFPGCPFLVWIKPPSACRCEKKQHKTKESCECNVQSSIFDSGSFITTGSKSLQDTNRAKHLIIEYTKKHQLKSPLLPRNQRFQARRNEIFKVSENQNGRVATQPSKSSVQNISFHEMLSYLPDMSEIPDLKRSVVEAPNLHIFTKACLLRNFYLVGYLLKTCDRKEMLTTTLDELRTFSSSDKFIRSLEEKLLRQLEKC